MADNLNPFFAEDDLIENEIEIDTPRAENIPCPDLLPESEGLTFDAIAVKLLKDNFILTALEFHTELIESGREVPRLRDFFSNPANFERTKQAELSSPGLPRTSSCQTFDSLDFARYSDDGDRQESDKVAVLEFELRKAQDTIKSLRASLTRTAETELPTPETPGDRIEEFAFETPGIRPYETRALNYLINEYLLQSDYKLTSVTFAEENENQDFEDWDDVGLNIPKPPDLLHLYRDFSQHILPKSDSTDFSSMVNMDEQLQESEQQLTCLTEQLQSQIKQLEEQLQLLRIENEFLSQQMKSLERDVEANKLMRSSTPAVSPVCTPSKKENKEIHLNRALQNNATFNGTMSLDSEESKGESGSDSNKDGTIVPVAMETVDGREKDNAVIDSDKSESDTNVDSMAVEPGTQMHSPDFTIGEDSEKWQSAQRQISDPFHKALLNIAFHVAQDNRIVSEVSRITDSPNDVVLMLARCLPHVVPNVILAKREELIPLLLSTATLHPDPDQRDHLLNSLFNLIKRPDVDQRQMILTGCVAFAQHVGPTRVESELLPQCWEEITHKYPERRLLVAEACGALAPYLPNEIRSSLVLSMLNQMLQEDKTEEVRESVVKSLGLLMGFIDEKDKYSQGAELLRISLGDGSERVIAAAQQVFLPAFGMWASELGVLETNLIQSFVKDMEQLVKTAQASQPTNASNLPLDRNKFSLYVKTITELIPLLFASVLNSAPFQDKVNSVEDVNTINVLSRFPKPASELSNLSVIMGSAERLAAFVHLYEAYIGEEWYEPWEAYMWVAGDLIPQLLVILNVLDVASQSYVHCLAQLFYNLCRTFGRTFTMTKVKPKFHAVLNVPEDQQDANVPVGNTALTKCTVPVYVSGVLSAFNQEEDTNQLKSFLQDLLCTLALCHASLDSIKSAFTELSGNSDYHDLLLQVLWEGVVHTSAHVRAAAAQMFELLIKGVDETLVSTRVVPALVTLASDPEISVRIPTVSGFGMIMESVTSREMLDKVHMQFMTFMEDPIYKDQHGLYVELIRTFARIGPNAEPKFRDEFVLPRLAVLAASNNQTSNDTRRMDVALQLFEAYSALSCCFISDQLVSEAMLPGLKCLHKDMEYLMPDHAPVIASMIREFQDKLDASKSMDRNLNATGFTVTAPGTPPMQHVEEVRNKVMNRIKDSRPNLSKIFGKKNQNNQ